MRILSLHDFDPMCNSRMRVVNANGIKAPAGLGSNICVQPGVPGGFITVCCCNCFQVNGLAYTYTGTPGMDPETDAIAQTLINAIISVPQSPIMIDVYDSFEFHSLFVPDNDLGAAFYSSFGNSDPCATRQIIPRTEEQAVVLSACNVQKLYRNTGGESPNGAMALFTQLTAFKHISMDGREVIPDKYILYVGFICQIDATRIVLSDGRTVEFVLQQAWSYSCEPENFNCGGGTFNLVGALPAGSRIFVGQGVPLISAETIHIPSGTTAFTINSTGSPGTTFVPGSAITFDVPGSISVTGVPCD